MIRWAILTGEYPPEPGGVSDYTRLVARGLAEAGDHVRVFAPHTSEREDSPDAGVSVHRLPGFGPRSLARLDQMLADESKPDRILVQYVPHAYGWKAMNLPFAAWIAARASRIAPVYAVFHEVAFPFSWRPATHALLGAVTRVMARLIAGAAERVFVTIPAWGDLLERIAPQAQRAEWLPVPSTLDAYPHPDAVAAVKAQFAPAGDSLVGHFGTYGTPIAALLIPAIAELLRLSPGAGVLFIGRGSLEFRDRFLGHHPDFAGRAMGTGALPGDAVSAHMRACDLLLQPYPDGISSRRTSAMAGLANGLPMATNLGPLSESLWTHGGVAAIPTPDPVGVARLAARLLADRSVRAELGRDALALYRRTFALEHTLSKLRGTR